MSGRDGELTALVVQHEGPTPPGHISGWLDERRAHVDVFRIDTEERDVDPRDYDLVVSLGSEFAAFDDSVPWLEREMRLFRAASEADVPHLGICFGGQLLARVLGGESFRGKEAEIGWLPARTHDPALVSEGPWFQWHFDTFTPPPTATVLAESDAGPQAFVVGRSMGVQFHPEVTPEIMESWVGVYRHELDEEGVDPDALLEETYRLAGASRGAAWRLFDGFLERVAGIQRSV
ncbi:MAG: type 1 glutamine amidotransferase [Gaiellaceae bacterium]